MGTSRYDKYDGVSGGFRAVANADNEDEAKYGVPQGASLNATGKVLVGGAAGQSGYVGVTVVDKTKRKAGAVLDVMTDGEIVDVEGLAAGTTYYLSALGVLTAAAPAAGAAGYKVGHTVEAWRLVVRFQRISVPV